MGEKVEQEAATQDFQSEPETSMLQKYWGRVTEGEERCNVVAGAVAGLRQHGVHGGRQSEWQFAHRSNSPGKHVDDGRIRGAEFSDER